jgi:hypothetical protein
LKYLNSPLNRTTKTTITKNTTLLPKIKRYPIVSNEKKKIRPKINVIIIKNLKLSLNTRTQNKKESTNFFQKNLNLNLF